MLFAFISLIISILISYRICSPNSRLHILDNPNRRSLHIHPVPRTGGVAIIAAVVVGFIFTGLFVKYDMRLLIIGLVMVLVASLSYWDDQHGLTVKIRLFVQFFCALILVGSGLALQNVDLPGLGWALPFWLSILFSIIYIVWMINLYNFMDGMDGFAGGMTVIGFSTFAVLGYFSGHTLFFSASLVIAFSAVGFLVFNYPPARIFMGDTGSASLGLLAGAFSIWGSVEGIFPFWIALLIFSPFILDATVTLFKRLIRGEKIWEAHKSHYYQRLVEKGWGHKRTVNLEYGVMLICSLTAVLMSSFTPNIQWIILCLIIMMYLIIGYYIDTLVNQKQGV